MEPDDFDTEHGISAVDKALQFLKASYAWEFSSSDFHVGGWYSWAEGDQDYRTGAEEMRSFHLKGFEPGEEREIYRQMMQRK